MRISEQIERLENKVRQLEKENFELKAARDDAAGSPDSGLLEGDVPNRDTPASGDAKAAPKRGRPPKAKKTAETE